MLRLYSYIFHLVLALFLLGLSTVALLSANNLRLSMLPWSGAELNQWLLWGSLVGILSIVLAVTGIFRYLFPLWALTVLALMVRGYILGPHLYAGGKDEFYQALLLIAGAAVAFLASLTLFKIRRPRRA